MEIPNLLIMYHYHSGSGDLSALLEYSSVRVTTRRFIGATRCSVVVQGGAVFTRSRLDAGRRVVQKGFVGVFIHESIASVIRRILIGLRIGTARGGGINLVPIELISKFNMQARAAL
jgi:hypothetical protein